MKNQNYLKNYFQNFKRLITFTEIELKKINIIKNLLLEIKKKRKKILFFGNGGSAAIFNHAINDFSKNLKIKTFNGNESSLLTCFANDYGYENWVQKIIEINADNGDLIFLISSSGESKNLINAAKFAKKKKYKIITYTGFSKNNSLKKLGNINFWINSKNFNLIENAHQILILSIIDLSLQKDF
jgi:D-sedoheptulose 7-phosphate isomerase